MDYQQLTQEERYQIWILRKARRTRAQIARKLGRHPSTIGRELKRNSEGCGYRPRQAQRMAAERKSKANRRVRFTEAIRQVVEEKLKLQWSPEQISGWLKRHNSRRFPTSGSTSSFWATGRLEVPSTRTSGT